MKYFSKVLLSFLLIMVVKAIDVPGSCKSDQYYDSGSLSCQSCPANTSMVVSSDGFSCTCQEHSVPTGPQSCKPCNTTDVISTDRHACVPRRCQASAGRLVCRKCPADYISVTQNLDGSPLKEVQCVKCARGYKPSNNICARCESCVCSKQEIVVRGRCLPKRFVNDRPKYEETMMHPNELLDVVKEEYFCTQNSLLACQVLAHECVKNFYVTDLAGPCRLWVQSKIIQPKGLPKLIIDTTSNEKDPREIGLSRGMNTIHLVLATYTTDGGLKISYEQNSQCALPLKIVIGKDFTNDCQINVSQVDSSLNETLTPFLYLNGDLKALPVSIRKTDGHYVQTGVWQTNKFRRYFLIDKRLSITANMTNTIYLRTLLIKLRIERNKVTSTSLRIHITIEAHYATKSPLSEIITTTLKVEHEMPSAGVLRGLEIWGGILGALLSVYAAAQWRGNLRRGGLHFSLVPFLAAAVADTLYFSAWFSTLHALAAEAGTLGMTLPLSHSEERVVKAFIYSAVALKALKVIWINWNQCQYDIFFIDWSEYNPPSKDAPVFEKSDSWRASCLAKEWSRMQAIRRASPVYTVPLALITLQLMLPWQTYIPESQSYRWALATLAYLCSYVVVMATRYVMDKVLGSPTSELSKVCTGVGLSLLVFQEEYYAHYVHGRNDDSDARSLVGPLAACRVVCAPQLRAVYKQLSAPGLGMYLNVTFNAFPVVIAMMDHALLSSAECGLGEKESKKVLLSKFLAAFFERALDGLSWVASERTVPERLLDVELVAREAGNTSVLLYDPDDNSPSCFAVTWWGEEWTLGTFDAIYFGCLFISTGNSLISGLATLATWQIIKFTKSWFNNKNQKNKLDLDITFHCH